ncbi:DMT family transporter [Deltaproteobacteria bacterium TL4]
MFFILVITAVFGYSLQANLLIFHSRKLDRLSVAIYRNLSFVIAMLPLLFFTDLEAIGQVRFWIGELLVSGISGALFLWMLYSSYRFLPIVVANTFYRSIYIVGIATFGIVFYHESFSVLEMLCAGIILCGIIYMNKQKYHMPHLEIQTSRGIIYAMTAGLLVATSIFLMSKISREINPWVAGYFWEVSIGLSALTIGWIRLWMLGKKIQRVSLKEFLKIALAASPTVLGTGCFAYASNLGPIGMMGALGQAGLIFDIFFSRIFHKEQLQINQFLGIAIIFSGIIGLKLFGSP